MLLHTSTPTMNMVPLQHTVPCVTDDKNSDDEEDNWDNEEIDRPIQPRNPKCTKQQHSASTPGKI
eukprot:13603551-Ditylum_brightwellii.AAC.1